MRRLLYAVLVLLSLLPFLYGGCGGSGGTTPDVETELLTNGGFETGDLTGWTKYALDGASAAGSISVVDATFVPSSSNTLGPFGLFDLAGPSEGSWYAVSDQHSPSTDALVQEFSVPMGDDEITLTFDMFVLDLSGGGPSDAGVLDHGTSGPNQHARVDIISAVAGTFDTGSGVIRNLYLNTDGYVPVLPYISYSFDLSGDLTSGETYKLRFAQTNNEGNLHMGIDNVSIKSK